VRLRKAAFDGAAGARRTRHAECQVRLRKAAFDGAAGARRTRHAECQVGTCKRSGLMTSRSLRATNRRITHIVRSASGIVDALRSLIVRSAVLVVEAGNW
jgi:hypothetical protein